MSGIFGHLNLSDTDRVFNQTVGQAVIWDAVTDYVNRANAELNDALALFVERTTSDFKLRYKLPGGGHLQRRRSDGRFASVKAVGAWDVAFPLEDFGAALSGNDVDMAYMTVQELDRHVATIVAQNVNTVRYELLKALLNNAADTFVDDHQGSLSILPLANGDSVLYPPLIGVEVEATENHYLESGYASSAISDTNNPYATIVAELVEHFGNPTGGSNIAVMINSAQGAKTRALTDFVGVADIGVRYGITADLAAALPNIPGKIIGRMEGFCWVSEWPYVPADYMVGIHLDETPPVIRRIDPADTGLGDGLQLVSTDEEFPFNGAFWRHRFGFGVGNRLNGVVMELGTGGTYSVPSGY